MKHHFTESDAVLNALCAFSPHSLSLFSDELLNSLAEKYQSLLNVNKELLHSQIIVAKNMFQNPDSTLERYNQLSTMHCTIPDLLVLFKLALTVPVASAFCGTQFFRDAQNQESTSDIRVRNANK